MMRENIASNGSSSTFIEIAKPSYYRCVVTRD